MLTDVRVVASELVFEKLHTSLKLYTSTSDPHHHSITQNHVLYYQLRNVTMKNEEPYMSAE